VARKRDYKAEYQKRIERGLSQGLSRSESRGHGKPKGGKGAEKAATFVYDPRLELGVKAMRKGDSLTKAAKDLHVAPERLRTYVRLARVAERKSGRWFISDDRRSRIVPIYSSGKFHKVTVSFQASQKAGAYMSAVKAFLSSNDTSALDSFRGESVVDLKGKRYFLETRPNVLYRLDASGSQSYEEIYRIVA
jgi:hypothetical protein